MEKTWPIIRSEVSGLQLARIPWSFLLLSIFFRIILPVLEHDVQNLIAEAIQLIEPESLDAHQIFLGDRRQVGYGKQYLVSEDDIGR